MKTTFILSTLFAATAFAAFHAVELPQLIPPGTGGGKMARRGEAGVEIYGKICDRNTECAGVCNEITGCAKDQEDYCNDGESPKRCRCAVQSPGPLCLCLVGDLLGPLKDSCKRGLPYGGKSWCVYDCGGDGSVAGNGDCNVQHDPCLAP
ncbi:unnamed protein product [Zymoseptoria tritici ST99CH_1A5]|uniref:EGF-like domain-containing protein n=2 Tax=Zymoseptoria tritici TaxID=1047171 RepID=A0A2H1FPL5_ZYMTR|nr:unnamed protein product [Zymoseptoria tritici ST99CH_1E4]SMY20507.1 unnamed protein product [Zymoseptoria tritici ST99CH_1A5]